MSSFTDQMIDDGFDDPEEYLGYLEDEALKNVEESYTEDEHSDESEERKEIIGEKSTSFHLYFQKMNGTGIQIDFKNRKVFLFNSDNKIASTIFCSRGIKNNFKIVDLLKTDHKVGDQSYFVFEKGYQGRNWLWIVEVVAIL